MSSAAAISAGFGVGAALRLYAEEFPNLVHLTPPDVVDTRDLWILMPSDLVRVARVRTVWDFIVDVTTTEPHGRKAPKSTAEGRAH